MRVLTTMTVLTVLVAVGAAPAASAKAEPTKAAEQAGTPAPGSNDGGIVLRRDGSKAVPFVANLSPTTQQADDGFDWGDAAAGAGIGIVLTGLGAAGWIALRRRRESGVAPVGVAH